MCAGIGEAWQDVLVAHEGESLDVSVVSAGGVPAEVVIKLDEEIDKALHRIFGAEGGDVVDALALPLPVGAADDLEEGEVTGRGGEFSRPPFSDKPFAKPGLCPEGQALFTGVAVVELDPGFKLLKECGDGAI